MACSRGKASPNAATKLKLFTDSAGFCQNPECPNEIFPKGFEDFPHIAEMAHIFAATDGGPRTDVKLSKEERGAYNNIILLCANCHTLIDKTPEKHTAELMQSWKQEHEFRRQKAFGGKNPSSRDELRLAIQPLLRENKMIHSEVGPDNDYQFNPEAPEASVWKERVRRTIIPNSIKVLMYCDANTYLLTEAELHVIERFRYHVQGMIIKHMEGRRLKNSIFPDEMNNILLKNEQ